MFVAAKDAHSPIYIFPPPLEGHIKINDNLELYRFAKKGYIVSRESLLVTVNS